jgi:hypothetical protein
MSLDVPFVTSATERFTHGKLSQVTRETSGSGEIARFTTSRSMSVTRSLRRSLACSMPHLVASESSGHYCSTPAIVIFCSLYHKVVKIGAKNF